MDFRKGCWNFRCHEQGDRHGLGDVVGNLRFGRFLPYEVESTPVSRPLPQAVWHKMNCFGCNWHCQYRSKGDDRPLPCIEGVTVEAVLAEISNVLPRGVKLAKADDSETT